VGAEAGQKPNSEGPWTKAGVIIAAISGLLGLILAYLALAASIHWEPFPQAGSSISATADPHPTASATVPLRQATDRSSPAATATIGPTALAAMYYGTITYPNGGYTSKLQLCSVTDTAGHLSGNLIVWTGPGSGPFSGSIVGTSRISFSVSNPSGEYGTMDFFGSIAQGNVVSGTFIISNPREQGTWSATADHPFSRSLC